MNEVYKNTALDILQKIRYFLQLKSSQEAECSYFENLSQIKHDVPKI